MPKRAPSTSVAVPTHTTAVTSVEHADGWENVITGMGVLGRDKRLGGNFFAGPALGYEQLQQLFAGDDLVARVVEKPVDEMVREWIEISGDGFAKLARAMDALHVRERMHEAACWARLYGGSVIIMFADDRKDLSEPLIDAQAGRILGLSVLDRHEVQITKRYNDPSDARYGEPELYRVTRIDALSSASALVDIHESRILRFDGALTGRRRKAANSGWNDGVVQRVYDVVRDFASSFNGIAVLMQDASQAVLKINGLQAMLASDPTGSKVLQRIRTLDLARSVGRMIPLDAAGEDFHREATPFTGIPEVLDRMAGRLSAATELPISMLVGQGPGGLNASGESDHRAWYNFVSAQQERLFRRPLQRLLKLLAPTMGYTPPESAEVGDEIPFTFRPLWSASEKETAETRYLVAQTDQIYLQNGVLDAAEVSISRFGGDEYSIETTLDTEGREPEAPMLGGVELDPSGAPASADVQKTALNGAQIASLLEIVKAVGTGDVPKSSGLQLVLLAYPDVDQAEVAKLFKDVKEGSVEKEAPAAFGAPAPGMPGKNETPVTKKPPFGKG